MTRLLTMVALALALTGGPQPAEAGGGKTARSGKAVRGPDKARATAPAARSKAARTNSRVRSRESRRGQPTSNPFHRQKKVIIDIGGEGRVRNAINLNPGTTTSTTGAPGRPIPNHIRGVGENMPLRSRSADVLRVESAPLRPGAARELARVIKPGGRIVLRHPEGYAQKHHGEVAKTVGGSMMQRTHGGMTITIIRAP